MENDTEFETGHKHVRLNDERLSNSHFSATVPQAIPVRGPMQIGE